MTVRVGSVPVGARKCGGRRRIVLRAVGALLLLGLLGSGIALWVAITTTDAPLRAIALPVPGSVVVDAHAGRTLIASTGPYARLSLLNTRSGDVLSTANLGSGCISDMILAARSDRAFVLDRAPCNAGHMLLSLVDTRTGALLHTRVVPLVAAIAVDEGSGHLFMAVGAQQGGVDTLDARSGALIPIHSARVGSQPWALAVDHPTRRVFVANYRSDTVSVLDADTGRVVRTVRVGQGPVALAVDELSARVFVANQDGGTVSMLDARSGAVLSTVGAGAPNALAVDARAGRVVVTNGGVGTVSLLDAVSGAVVGTLTVGGSPMAVAVDGRTGRAFVTDTQVHRALFTLLRPVAGGRLSWAGENNDDGVGVIDTRSGTLLRTVHVGPAAGIAVDSQAGHAFVVSPGNNSVSMLDATH